MHATRIRGTGIAPPSGRPNPNQLLEQLDWIEATGAYHKAALARLASAKTEAERRAASHEEALAREIHQIAVSRLPPPS